MRSRWPEIRNMLRFVFGVALARVSGTYGFSTGTKTYRYFAFGSNMVETTMTALRELHPLDASAAVLPGYRLKFNLDSVLDGAAASVERSTEHDDCVHGVVYTLSSNDFSRVGFTEGVPLAYRWEKCPVVPYVGDGAEAGTRAMVDQASVEAYTLVSSFGSFGKESRPSRSYRDILIRGAMEWSMDKGYIDMLKAIPVAQNLLIRDGLAGPLLRLAELRQARRRTKK